MILKLNVTESTNTAQKYSWTWWNPWTTLKLADNKPHSWNRLQPRNTVESNWRIIEVTFTLNFIYFSKLHCSVRNFGKKDNLCANPSRISSGYWYWKNMEEYTLIQISYCWGQSIRSGIKIAPWDGQQIFGSELILAKKSQRLSESGLKVTPRIIQRQFCDNGYKTIYQVTKL